MVRGAAGGRGRPRGRVARTTAGTRSQPDSVVGDHNGNADLSTSAATPSSGPISISASPAPSATQPGPSSSTRGTPRPVGSAMTGRLRPRNVRRNEEQRELLAQQEAKKDSERAAEERRRRGRGGRFRGRRGRGNQFGPRMSTAGPSALFANSQGGSGPSRFGGGGFGRGGGSGRGGGAGRNGHKLEEDEKPWEVRINTDKLGVNGVGDDEDPEEERTLMAVSSQPGPRPLGITRREEKEREMVVITTAELEAQQGVVDEESIWISSGSGEDQSPVEGAQDDNKLWHAAPKDITQIKTEDGALETVNPDAPTIDYDSKRKVPLPAGAEEDESKPATKSIKPKKPSAFSLDTEEQWEDESVQYILNTLAAASLQDGTKGAEEEAPAISEPQPFLCKFGPIMPPLRPRARPEPRIKNEHADTVMLDQVAPAPVDLTQDGGSGGNDAEEDTDPFKHGGYIGKLVIRKSGKAELDYGGIKYSMRRGIKSSGVTSYIVLEEEDVKPGSEEQYAGRAVAMGTLLGKFNFGPVWEEQEEWVVNEEDLRAPAADDDNDDDLI
ncbi:uncharacterized protein DNG_01941 [Cephalotrichum gorgonifer]|uniref:Uncharacterized protein n=1 Tax=Cephalotrichum gorgonifer TaxID=2041049 RepID=A0AAE8MSQ0_9PEZI|nr:uncharacterized protein DNG_01941 [Cephalotrichum gorgonifer]